MLINNLTQNLETNGLIIKENNYNEIFDLYSANIEYAKLSKSYPVTMENVIEDIETIPSFIHNAKKYYISIYNKQQELVAVLDFLDGYSYQHNDDKETVWIGLLQVAKKNQHTGLATQIIESLFAATNQTAKTKIQLGVIKENKRAYNFWTKQGFQTFTETAQEKYDLYLMEKSI